MSRLKKIALLLFILYPFLTYTQAVSKNEKYKVIQRIKVLIDSNYVFVDKAKLINNSIDSLDASGKYDAIKDYKAFAGVLTNDLVAISKDKHFVIQYRPELIKSRRESRKRQQITENNDETESQEEEIDLDLWYAQKENFGFEKVEILDGNIGYIKLNFFHFLEWVQPTIDASMRFVANTDALIIDLRDNGGGYRSDSYIGSYFFDEKSTLWNTSYDRSKDLTENRYTYENVNGNRYLNKPIYILVGEKSFSRAEGFAYCMKHFNKAIIVGQTTPGAAHGINFLEMDDNFMIQVPVERNIHPVTKTDWEGIGVIPHIKTSKEESFNVAYTKALDTLLASKKDQALGVHYERLQKKYKEIKKKISNK
ncbi:S41 family peptidase [Aquimarina litoralis]|uniref:S41 family peptidase n=1 Tax=Aquimarina litoralis TaxID=584605 RepID=UPI001C57D9D1|nr:S41 family peptidase [Aquimarina litoralis]MBW1294178.1 hypothetical protein [Aquimarina litoralis]